MTEEKVTEITCPACERVWPTIAEQGIVTELYGQCYACMIADVVKIRDERAAEANYLVQNCSNCGGLPGKVEKCIHCGGKGWETSEKDESGTSKIIYPH